MATNDSNVVQTRIGPGLPALLTCIFAAAKVFGYISWSWWWVFSPILIAFGIGAAILLFVLLVFLIAEFNK